MNAPVIPPLPHALCPTCEGSGWDWRQYQDDVEADTALDPNTDYPCVTCGRSGVIHQGNP